MRLYASFHGGSTETSVNNILDVSNPAVCVGMLQASESGAMPALCELRGFTSDRSGNLYVLNAYKEFSQILEFVPSAAGCGWTFSSVFAGGNSSELRHPFSLIFGGDGDLYVSNQDPADQKTPCITRYEGPTKKHPGKFKGVFADGFMKLRGLATNGANWYVADAGDDCVRIYDAAGTEHQPSLDVKEPVHLLFDGSKYLFIGSEKCSAVYRYDTQTDGSTPELFISSQSTAPIDATSGIAILGDMFYVGSRKAKAINQYPISKPASGSVFVSRLSDSPEFLVALGQDASG